MPAIITIIEVDNVIMRLGDNSIFVVFVPEPRSRSRKSLEAVGCSRKSFRRPVDDHR